MNRYETVWKRTGDENQQFLNHGFIADLGRKEGVQHVYGICKNTLCPPKDEQSLIK